MNKMIKGAAVAGLGVALLLGGGGTLAVWNADQESSAGTIVAGNLDLQSGAGQWTSNLSGAIADISAYRVVPGETLTYAQPLEITLLGDELTATLTVTGADTNSGFVPANVEVSGPVLTTDDDGQVVPGSVLTEDTPSDVTATTTFKFLSTTTGRESTNAAYDFSGVGYLLEQQVPSEG